MNYKIILISIMLVMIAGPAIACPPQFWVDKINWQRANNYTEINATCWMDSQGSYHNVSIESVIDQNNILGYKYGDYCQWTTFKMDNKTLWVSFENLDATHRAHESMQSPISNLIANWQCFMIPAGIILILTLIGLLIRPKDKENK